MDFAVKESNDSKFEEAIVIFDKAIEMDSEFYMAISNKSNCFNQLKRYGESIECINIITALKNGKLKENAIFNINEYLNLKAMLLSRLNRFE